MLLRQKLGLRYETTPKQLRFVLTSLREMILAHPQLLEMKGSEKEARVRFVQYGDYSLDIEMFVYVDAVMLPEFLDIQEGILLQVNDIVQAAGTGFAFPSQTTYLAHDQGPKQDLDQL